MPKQSLTTLSTTMPILASSFSATISLPNFARESVSAPLQVPPQILDPSCQEFPWFDRCSGNLGTHEWRVCMAFGVYQKH
jgi:hypothetical protein